MRKTPLLRNLLEQYKTMLETDEYESFVKEVERLLERFYSHLGTFAAGAARGREVQRLIDEQVELSSHIQTSCRKGCGACCHLEVEITSDDADVLATSLSEASGLNFDLLNQQAKRQRLDDEWKKGAVPQNRCAFLGADNACQNYSNRPAICRKHSVMTPVSECETLGGQPQPKIMPMAEIIMSAAVSQPGIEFGSLSKMLRKALDPQKPAEASPAEAEII